MTPVFLTKNKRYGYAKKLGEDNAHLKLFVKQNNSEGIPAIGFGLGNKMELTTKSPLKRCIVLMKMNGMVKFQSIEIKILDNV
jgi:single-stranded-DNA-specific exonuclease